MKVNIKVKINAGFLGLHLCSSNELLAVTAECIMFDWAQKITQGALCHKLQGIIMSSCAHKHEYIMLHLRELNLQPLSIYLGFCQQIKL